MRKLKGVESLLNRLKMLNEDHKTYLDNANEMLVHFIKNQDSPGSVPTGVCDKCSNVIDVYGYCSECKGVGGFFGGSQESVPVPEHIYNRMNQDIEDMKNSRCTSFERCHKCNRLHDNNYICPYCIEDNGCRDED